MQNALLIGLIVFAVILAGASAGWVMRKRLPANHLTDETKSLVSVSMAVVATLSALVLGLLISNANSSFTALGGEVTTLSAQLIRLDQVLRRYGRKQSHLESYCGIMSKPRVQICFPTTPQMSKSAVLQHMGYSSGSRTRCLP